MLTHRNVVSDVQAVLERIAPTQDDVFCRSCRCRTPSSARGLLPARGGGLLRGLCPVGGFAGR